jgi:hypothetical protein
MDRLSLSLSLTPKKASCQNNETVYLTIDPPYALRQHFLGFGGKGKGFFDESKTLLAF